MCACLHSRYCLDIELVKKYLNYYILQLLLFQKQGTIDSHKRKLVCSMITISENATPGTHEEVNLWCEFKKQECQVFHYSSNDL